MLPGRWQGESVARLCDPEAAEDTKGLGTRLKIQERTEPFCERC